MKKKILLVVGGLGTGGGAERVVAEVGSKLNELDYDVTYLTFTEDKNEYEHKGERIVYDKYNIIPGISALNFDIKVFFWAKKIADLCDNKDIDTVISHLYKPNLACILSKRLFGNKAKIILTTHNNPIKKFGRNGKYFIKIFYPKADNVITVSKHTEKIYKSRFDLDNVKTIYNPINLKTVKNLGDKGITKDINKILENNFVFISVGSHSKQKAQWYLLRAFKKVNEIHSNTKLIIRGSGSFKGKLKNLAKKLKIEDEVIFLGWVETIYPYLKNSDCFVLSSLYEGLPMVLIETLSQSTPIISADCVSGPRELLCPELKLYEEIEYPYFGRYGILTNPLKDEINFRTLKENPLSKSEEMLADMMIKIKENDELREKYSYGLERAKDFDTNNIVKKWEDII